jgi:hypothetical protein
LTVRSTFAQADEYHASLLLLLHSGDRMQLFNLSLIRYIYIALTTQRNTLKQCRTYCGITNAPPTRTIARFLHCVSSQIVPMRQYFHQGCIDHHRLVVGKYKRPDNIRTSNSNHEFKESFQWKKASNDLFDANRSCLLYLHLLFL